MPNCCRKRYATSRERPSRTVQSSHRLQDRVRKKNKLQDSLSIALLRGCITTDRGKWTVGASIVETIFAREREAYSGRLKAFTTLGDHECGKARLSTIVGCCMFDIIWKALPLAGRGPDDSATAVGRCFTRLRRGKRQSPRSQCNRPYSSQPFERSSCSLLLRTNALLPV